MKKLISLILCLSLCGILPALAEPAPDAPEGWTEGSAVLSSILAFADRVTDEESPDYLPPEKRVAVFDSDGTLYGELFPTYFDVLVMLRRVLHDDAYQAPAEDQAAALSMEEALYAFQPEPDTGRSSSQMAAAAFRGMTVEEYRAYVRDVKQSPVFGFTGMTYGEGFYLPMVSLVRYLTEKGFIVYICSGTEVQMLRELTQGTLDRWVPPYRVIGSTYTLAASGQGSAAARSYTYAPDDRVIFTGEVAVKNQKMNKVLSIVGEIGLAPALVFGNSSGDLAMAQYAVQHGGKAYMLLCDDTERDYGRPDVAEAFRRTCEALGFETISMRDDFATIYGWHVVKAPPEALEPAA